MRLGVKLLCAQHKWVRTGSGPLLKSSPGLNLAKWYADCTVCSVIGQREKGPILKRSLSSASIVKSARLISPHACLLASRTTAVASGDTLVLAQHSIVAFLSRELWQIKNTTICLYHSCLFSQLCQLKRLPTTQKLGGPSPSPCCAHMESSMGRKLLLFNKNLPGVNGCV